MARHSIRFSRFKPWRTDPLSCGFTRHLPPQSFSAARSNITRSSHPCQQLFRSFFGTSIAAHFRGPGGNENASRSNPGGAADTSWTGPSERVPLRHMVCLPAVLGCQHASRFPLRTFRTGCEGGLYTCRRSHARTLSALFYTRVTRDCAQAPAERCPAPRKRGDQALATGRAKRRFPTWTTASSTRARAMLYTRGAMASPSTLTPPPSMSRRPSEADGASPSSCSRPGR